MIKDTKTKSVTEVSLERLCLTVCVFITGNRSFVLHYFDIIVKLL